jgi:hypothetical protein
MNAQDLSYTETKCECTLLAISVRFKADPKCTYSAAAELSRPFKVKDEKRRLKEEKEKKDAEAKERKKEAKLKTKANSVQAQLSMDDFR